MTFDHLLEQLNYKLVERQQRPLNTAEMIVLGGIWQYQTYGQIAEAHGYSTGYFTNVVAPELCRKISELIGKPVNKKNCRLLLELYFSASSPAVPEAIAKKPPISSPQTAAYPSGAVPLGSPYYVERSPYEGQIDREIEKAGALIRIKAPSEMGKTSLLLRSLDAAHDRGFHTINLNLAQVDRDIFDNLNRFLRWLSINVTHQLHLEPKLDDYWDEDMGSKVSCSLYFQAYLLDRLSSPLVLALDEAHQLFEYPHLVRDVLPLLRSWYEEAKRIPVWQKLRQIVVHSTDSYVPLHLNQSPFNVGLPIHLDRFSTEQVEVLAKHYGIPWTPATTETLMDLLDGHPALVHIALYHLSREEIPLSEPLINLRTATNIYRNHLQRHWITLQAQPQLAEAFRYVIDSPDPVSLEPLIAYQLSSTGLIRSPENTALSDGQDRFIPGCNLYRQYFQTYLAPPHE